MYLQKIQKAIAKQLGISPSEVMPADYFDEDLNMGEMELMQLLEELESSFDIELIQWAPKIKTVNDLVNIVREELE